MTSIFHYLNYRTYLKDFFDAKKKESTLFSYRVFARLAGFKSPNFIKLVILGQRNLSQDAALKLAQAMKLKLKEREFFCVLVAFNQCTDRQEKNFQWQQLQTFKSFQEVKTIDVSYHEYLSHWLAVALREMILLPSFREDPTWIQKRLKYPVTELEIKKTIHLLLDLGLVKRDRRRRLVSLDRNLATEPEVAGLAAANYHEQMIELAKQSIDASRPSVRDLSSVTVAMDEATFLEAKRRVQDFRRELNVLLSQCKEPSAVYQMNFQIFNLTHVPWEKK